MQLSDSPLPEYNQSTYSANPTWRHTARKGNEQFDVIVHGASSLPSHPDGHVPLPYVTMLVVFLFFFFFLPPSPFFSMLICLSVYLFLSCLSVYVCLFFFKQMVRRMTEESNRCVDFGDMAVHYSSCTEANTVQRYAYRNHRFPVQEDFTRRVCCTEAKTLQRYV